MTAAVTGDVAARTGARECWAVAVGTMPGVSAHYSGTIQCQQQYMGDSRSHERRHIQHRTFLPVTFAQIATVSALLHTNLANVHGATGTRPAIFSYALIMSSRYVVQDSNEAADVDWDLLCLVTV